MSLLPAYSGLFAGLAANLCGSACLTGGLVAPVRCALTGLADRLDVHCEAVLWFEAAGTSDVVLQDENITLVRRNSTGHPVCVGHSGRKKKEMQAADQGHPEGC